MSIEFEEPKFNLDRQRYGTGKRNTPVINLLTKVGIVRSPEQANIVMIAISIACLITAGILIKIYVF